MLFLKNLLFLEALLLAALFLFREALQPQHRYVLNAKMFVLAAVTPVVGLFGMHVGVFYLYLAAVLAFMPRSRAELCSIYLLLLPSVPMVGLQVESAAIELTTLLFMNLGAAVGLMIWKGPVARRRIGLDLAVLLIIVLFSAMEVRDTSATNWARMLSINLLFYGVPYLLVSSAIVSDKHLRRALLTLAAAGCSVATVGLFEALRSWSLYQSFNAALGVPLPMLAMDVNVRAGFLRAPGPFLDPTSFGLFLAALMTLLVCLRRAFRPHLFLILLGLTALALLGTQSRGAWVAAIAGCLAVVCFRGRTLTIVTSAAMGMLLVVAVGIALPAYEEPVTPNMWGEPESTTDYRARLFTRGAEEFMDSPWTGFPKEEVRTRMVDLTQGQGIIDFVNSHLYVGLVAGLVGLIVWFGYLFGPPVMLWFNRRLLIRRKLMDVGAAIVGVNVVTFSALTFTSIIDRNCVWMLVFAGFIPALLNPRKQARLVAVAVPRAGEIVDVPAFAPATRAGASV